MQSGARFPLTLTLSLGEREQLSTARKYSLNSEHFPALPMVLPLPKGEGWGEGEGSFLRNGYGFWLRSYAVAAVPTSAPGHLVRGLKT